jgi:biopolymer transport protein TolR
MRLKHYHAISEINVTNLVDVVLVLLIIFMIAAPMLQSGVDINLPKTKASSADLGEGVVITITKEKKIFIDDKVIPPDKFEQKLTEIRLKKGAKSVYLRVDENVPYGVAVDIIGRIKSLGIENLGLVAEPKT